MESPSRVRFSRPWASGGWGESQNGMLTDEPEGSDTDVCPAAGPTNAPGRAALQPHLPDSPPAWDQEGHSRKGSSEGAFDDPTGGSKKNAMESGQSHRPQCRHLGESKLRRENNRNGKGHHLCSYCFRYFSSSLPNCLNRNFRREIFYSPLIPLITEGWGFHLSLQSSWELANQAWEILRKQKWPFSFQLKLKQPRAISTTGAQKQGLPVPYRHEHLQEQKDTLTFYQDIKRTEGNQGKWIFPIKSLRSIKMKTEN